MTGVEYSESLVQSLENELKTTFGPSYLRLSRQPHNSGNEFSVQLSDCSSTARLDNGAEQGVIEITSVGRPDTFYLGLMAPFELVTEKRYILHSLSLTVFHRVIEELIPMFRAEWDRLHAADANAIHAQPHWHFVQSPGRIERIVLANLRPIAEPSDFNPEPQQGTLFSDIADCGRFHFAMTSLWEKSDVPPPKRVFNSEDFRKWFFGLTKYIEGQLAFLARKMPRADRDAFSRRDRMEGVVE